MIVNIVMDKKAGILVYLLPFLFHKMAIEREFDSSPHLKQQEKTMLYLLTLCTTNIPTVPKKKRPQATTKVKNLGFKFFGGDRIILNSKKR